MNNQRFAALLYELADLQDIQGVAWKPIALRKAARTIETLKDDIKDIYAKGGIDALMEIPSVGQGIASKAVQFLEKGTFDELERTRKQLHKGIVDLMTVRGVGPKSVKVLYAKLKIKTLDELEKAASAGKIQKLKGFGVKSEQEILEGVKLRRKGQERQLLGVALPIAREIEAILKKVKGVSAVVIGGSVRRRRETVKDIDILAIAKDSKAAMQAFTSLPNVVKITGKGDTKSSVILEEGLTADLRVVPQKSFGAALQYFTGSVDHNVRVRQAALKKGLTLRIGRIQL